MAIRSGTLVLQQCAKQSNVTHNSSHPLRPSSHIIDIRFGHCPLIKAGHKGLEGHEVSITLNSKHCELLFTRFGKSQSKGRKLSTMTLVSRQIHSETRTSGSSSLLSFYNSVPLTCTPYLLIEVLHAHLTCS